MSKRFLIFLAGAFLIASIALLPPVVKAASAYERGLIAQKDGRHSTAIKYFEKAQKSFPDNASIIARLAISYFYNERIDECTGLLGSIEGRRVGKELGRQVQEVEVKLASIYFESEELGEALRLYGQEELETTAEKLEAYLVGNKNDVLGIFQLGSVNFDMGKYDEAERVYRKALELQPDFYSAYLNLAAVYREQGEFEKAEECCRKVLERNAEHPGAFAALSRIELEGHNNKAALEYAEKAFEYDSEDQNILSNLCLAYHYNGMTAQRDEILELLREKGYYDTEALQSVFEERPIKR